MFTRPANASDRRLPTHTAGSCTPAPHPSSEAHSDEASTGFARVRLLGLPLTCGSLMDQDPLGLNPDFAPRRYRRRTSERGQASNTHPVLLHRRLHRSLLPTSPRVPVPAWSRTRRSMAPRPPGTARDHRSSPPVGIKTCRYRHGNGVGQHHHRLAPFDLPGYPGVLVRHANALGPAFQRRGLVYDKHRIPRCLVGA